MTFLYTIWPLLSVVLDINLLYSFIIIFSAVFTILKLMFRVKIWRNNDYLTLINL